MTSDAKTFPSIDPAALPKHFVSAEAERRWDQVWTELGIHRYDPSRPREETFVVDTPPPTVSGSLHVGHVFSYTHTDLLVRYQRMRGRNIAYPMGWDDNGLPTERRVQNLFGIRPNPRLVYDPSWKPRRDRSKKEGIEEVWARHKKLARATRAGIEAMGLEVFAKAPSDVVTSVRLPDGIDGNALPKIMRDEYGVTIAGGQADLKGKICRVAHMGWMDLFDVLVALSALEIVLNRLGYEVEPGSGPGAAEKIFMEQAE